MIILGKDKNEVGFKIAGYAKTETTKKTSIWLPRQSSYQVIWRSGINCLNKSYKNLERVAIKFQELRE